MTRKLPPLNALRVFEAAARHGGFTGAAEELCVTAGAVSQQVKHLEAWLGVVLFRRLHRGLALTDAGRELGARLGAPLDQLAAAAAASSDASPALVINALPALAEKWLLPRLARFRKRQPDIDILLSAEDRVLDLEHEPVDIGLRYGDGNYPGLETDLLFAEEIFPVCSPTLLASGTPLREPADIHHHRLLHDSHWRDEWQIWLDAAGVVGVDPARGSRFTLYGLAIQAAIEGLGLAIGHSVLVAPDLETGRLVAPFNLRVPAPKRHYLVCRRDVIPSPAVRAFRRWIADETRDLFDKQRNIDTEQHVKTC